MDIGKKRGGILGGFLALLWLIFFFVAMMIFFLWKANYLRFEYGPQEERKNVIYDENTIAELKKKEELLAEKEKALNRREARYEDLFRQIQIEQKEVQKERAEIEKRVATINARFEEFTQDEEKNIQDLAKLYEPMKAARVATIFNELDVKTVAELLKRMKKQVSAKILGQIGVENAQRAAEISNIMQGKDKSDAFANAGE